MGNKGQKVQTLSEKQLKKDLVSQVKNEKTQQVKTQQKGLFQQNPAQLAKDQNGKLHPQWSEIIKKFQLKYREKTDEYVRKIRQETNNIGQECKKRFKDQDPNLIQCFKIVAEPIWKIQQQGQQVIMSLGRTANKCLLKGNKQNQCVEEVRKVFHSYLQQSVKDMQKIKSQM